LVRPDEAQVADALFDLVVEVAAIGFGHWVWNPAGGMAPGKRDGGPKTFAGNTLFSQDLSASEEAQLLDFLSFIRSKQPV